MREHRELTTRKLVWTLDADVQPSRVCNVDETSTKLLPIGDATVVSKHSSMELKHMFLGWLLTTLAEISTEAHNNAAWKHTLPSADEWDSVLAAAQTHHAGGPAPGMVHVGAAEHVDMGPG